MLIQTITQYLESHKRLVIPQLGAFIVKVPGGEVLFSELFRRDDGMLRSLLREQGMNELEAAGAIDRFAFEVRHAVQEGGEYRTEGLGIFSAGDNGTILFLHAPSAPLRPEAPLPTAQPAEAPQPDAPSEPRISVSPKVKPDPSLKGLRYGRPQKSNGAYRYANGGKRRVDRFLILAVAAALLAVAAIAYGYLRSSQDEKAKPIPTEQVQSPSAPASDAPQTEETLQ